MGISVKIDYENIPSQSNNIRGQALEINSKLIDIYQKIKEMHTYWYGKRYNDLVVKFNTLVPQLNQFLEVIVSEIPSMFATISNNFSEVDIKQNVAVVQKDGIQKIQAMPITQDVGMRYIEEEVAKLETAVIADITSVQSIMDSMQGTVGQIAIECENSNEFKAQFSKLANVFKQTLGDVKIQFTILMNTNREQIGSAEKLNSVK